MARHGGWLWQRAESEGPGRLGLTSTWSSMWCSFSPLRESLYSQSHGFFLQAGKGVLAVAFWGRQLPPRV